MKKNREIASRCAEDLMRYLHIMQDLKQRLQGSTLDVAAKFEEVLKENDKNLSKVYGTLSGYNQLQHQARNINFTFAIANHRLGCATSEELSFIQAEQYKVINRTFEFYESMIGGVFNRNSYSMTAVR